jgi:hypothetical protein
MLGRRLNRPAIAAAAVCRDAVNDPDDECGAGFGFFSPRGYSLEHGARIAPRVHMFSRTKGAVFAVWEQGRKLNA